MSNATLALCLLVNQRQRNKAIGIDRGDTQLQRGLSAYVRSLNRNEIENTAHKLTRAALIKATIDEYQTLAERLTDHIMANIDDADTRNEGVYTVKQIDALVNHLTAELETLWQPL